MSDQEPREDWLLTAFALAVLVYVVGDYFHGKDLAARVEALEASR